MKLGRKAIVTDSRSLKMAAYLTPSLPIPPASVDWTNGVTDYGMMLNNSLGCCTIAGCGHAIQVWSKATGNEVTVPDSDILANYEAWDGYNPNNPNTDSGGIELDVLNNWQKNGFFGHILNAFAVVNVSNIQEVQQAINLFGGLYIGINLPVTAQTQTVWDSEYSQTNVNSYPGSWGGHCVYVVGYDQSGITCITWGELKKMTYAFWSEYVDEAYALIGQDFLNNSGVDSQGFNIAQLKTDLALIK